MPDVTEVDLERIWGDSPFRVFLSHKASSKMSTSGVKTALAKYGVSSFVAHEDIKPTREWQLEIEKALFSMDAFVALMTKDFHDSDWTDQEIGVAYGRKIPIFAVRLGKNPYGFIGKFQGLSSSWENVAKDLIPLFIRDSKMIDAYIYALRRCSSYNQGNELARFLPNIANPSTTQVQQMVQAYNDNDELKRCYGFNGTGGHYYGPGLLDYLQNTLNLPYVQVDSNIELQQ